MFWRRPFYYEIEKLTTTRMDRGLIQDRIPEQCVATRTPIVAGTLGRFPPKARQFLDENYVDLGDFRVAGRFLAPLPPGGVPRISFDVAVPQRYALLEEKGDFKGLLDDRLYSGPRFLRAGPHTLVQSLDRGRVALVWARAVAMGFSPFHAGKIRP